MPHRLSIEDRPHWRSAAIAFGLRTLKRSWRVQWVGQSRFDALYERQTPLLVCFWHGDYLPIFPLMEGYAARVLTSQSERGAVLGDVCRRFGYRGVPIPDHHDAADLRWLDDLMGSDWLAAAAVDGPLGPRHKVKTGLMHLASRCGLGLMPLAVASRWHWTARSRWDRLATPLPASRLVLAFGEPLSVPAGLQNGAAHRLAETLGDRMRALDAEAARRLCGSTD